MTTPPLDRASALALVESKLTEAMRDLGDGEMPGVAIVDAEDLDALRAYLLATAPQAVTPGEAKDAVRVLRAQRDALAAERNRLKAEAILLMNANTEEVNMLTIALYQARASVDTLKADRTELAGANTGLADSVRRLNERVDALKALMRESAHLLTMMADDHPDNPGFRRRFMAWQVSARIAADKLNRVAAK